jgi:hypothetical protein
MRLLSDGIPGRLRSFTTTSPSAFASLSAFCAVVLQTPARAAMASMYSAHTLCWRTSLPMILKTASSPVVKRDAQAGGKGPAAASLRRRSIDACLSGERCVRRFGNAERPNRKLADALFRPPPMCDDPPLCSRQPGRAVAWGALERSVERTRRAVLCGVHRVDAARMRLLRPRRSKSASPSLVAVARCDDRTKLVYAVAYRERRRRANVLGVVKPAKVP